MGNKRLLKEVVGDDEKTTIEDVKVKVDVKVSVQGQEEEDSEKKESKAPVRKVLMG